MFFQNVNRDIESVTSDDFQVNSNSSSLTGFSESSSTSESSTNEPIPIKFSSSISSRSMGNPVSKSFKDMGGGTSLAMSMGDELGDNENDRCVYLYLRIHIHCQFILKLFLFRK